MNKISDEIICKVFAQYPQVPIAICEPNIETVSHYLEGVDFVSNEIIAERVNWNPQWIKLILKPLSELSDKDAIEVYESKCFPSHHRIATYEELKEWGHTEESIKTSVANTVKSCINNVWKEMPLFLWDFFRTNNYDVPHYLLGGKTLHESGLAIYK